MGPRNYPSYLGRGGAGLNELGARFDELWNEVDGSPYGSVFFTDPTNGNDNYDGESPIAGGETGPKATLQAAIDQCTDDKGDMIWVAPGSQEVTTAVLLNKQGITIRATGFGMAGPPSGERFTIKAASAYTDGPAATLSKACRIIGLGFEGRQTAGEDLLIDCGEAGGFEAGFSLILNCRFGVWYGAMDAGIRMKGGQYNHIIGCTFDGLFGGFGTAAIIAQTSGNIDPGFIRLFGNQFSGVGSGKHCVKHTNKALGVIYAHNYIDGGFLGNRGKFLDNNNTASEGLIADNWLGGLANKAAAFENLTNADLKFADNHYEEA